MTTILWTVLAGCAVDPATEEALAADEKAAIEALTCPEGTKPDNTPFGTLCCEEGDQYGRACRDPELPKTCAQGDTRVQTTYWEIPRTCTGEDCGGDLVELAWKDVEYSNAHYSCTDGKWEPACYEQAYVSRACTHESQTCEREICGVPVRTTTRVPLLGEVVVDAYSTCDTKSDPQKGAVDVALAVVDTWAETVRAQGLEAECGPEAED